MRKLWRHQSVDERPAICGVAMGGGGKGKYESGILEKDLSTTMGLRSGRDLWEIKMESGSLPLSHLCGCCEEGVRTVADKKIVRQLYNRDSVGIETLQRGGGVNENIWISYTISIYGNILVSTAISYQKVIPYRYVSTVIIAYISIYGNINLFYLILYPSTSLPVPSWKAAEAALRQFTSRSKTAQFTYRVTQYVGCNSDLIAA